MLKAEEALELTPLDIEAIRVTYSWLGDGWSPMEVRHAHHPNELILSNGHSVLFQLDCPPIPVPLSDISRCAIDPKYFQLRDHPSMDLTDGVVSHIWGGPRRNRSWHEASSLDWQVVLEDLTPADEGIMVRLVRPADRRVIYRLYRWGTDPGLREAMERLRSLSN